MASRKAETVVLVASFFIEPAIASDDVDLEVILKVVMLPGPTLCNKRPSSFLVWKVCNLLFRTCETFQRGLLSAFPSLLDIVTPDSESVIESIITSPRLSFVTADTPLLKKRSGHVNGVFAHSEEARTFIGIPSRRRSTLTTALGEEDGVGEYEDELVIDRDGVGGR
jgi:hypothetical protein